MNSTSRELIKVLYLTVILITPIISSCDDFKEKSCEALTVVDGLMTITTRDGVELELPDYVDLRRRDGEEYGCDFMSNLFITYLWYEGELISAGRNRSRVDMSKTVEVFLSVRISGEADLMTSNLESKNEKLWRYEGAVPHKRFPLIFYPRYHWDDPVNPSNTSRTSSMWGVVNTENRGVFSDRIFALSCRILPKNETDMLSKAENDFWRGLGYCSGGITASRDGKYLGAEIQVNAASGAKQEGMMELNLILDASVEKLQSFIKG